jgi:hypothetical protein
MKSFAILLLISGAIVLTAFFTEGSMSAGGTARPLRSADSDPATETGGPPAMRPGELGPGSSHKYIINLGDDDVYNNFALQGAITREIDYGSFRLLEIDENKVPGGRDALAAVRLPVRDDQNLIGLNGYVLNTTNPREIYDGLPSELRRGDIENVLARGSSPRGGLYLIQFAGPVKDEWVSELKVSGVEIVSYVPNNAYIVRGDAYAAENLVSFSKRSFVQFLGDYEPGFRISPALQAAYAAGRDTTLDVTVQVVDSPHAAKVIDQLRQLAAAFIQEHAVLNYRNVELTVRVANLAEIVRLSDVFEVEERWPRRILDEAQGQIVSGNLTGNVPSGPGYLSWMASKGFTSAQFSTFAVNVVDDCYSLTGHPDLPSSRIAFQNNPTSQTGVQGGHGFLNSNIVAGFNNGTGSANEDANGYNYGLGVAPFSRVGITAIFGAGASSPTAWENTAYGQNARISSNSWGFTTPVLRYDSTAQEFDRIVRDAQTAAGNQQLAVVFSAGNSGSASNTVGSPGTAKNIITVGASENVRQTGTDGCSTANSGADSANDIIGFSSRGPVNAAGGDGRVKPDVVAPGTHIEAGVPQSNYNGTSVCNQYWPTGQTLYGWSSGTSHSCPAVAGGAALVYQFFLNAGLAAPSPALIKAYMMNSAAYMSGTGAGGNLPSNSQGMGRMDLGRSFDNTPGLYIDQGLIFGTTGQTNTNAGAIATAAKPFRVTLVWTDAPGPTTGVPYVNNLDLEVTVNGVTYKGNVFSGANSVAGGTADLVNNSESVFLPAGTTGNFSITVRASNIAGDGVPGNADTTDQDFALLIYNATNSTPTSRTLFDFDGDGKADISVFRPSLGDWYRLNSSTGGFAGLHFGANGDRSVPADYDGDGKTDVAVYRPSTGSWYVLNSATNTTTGVAFGISTDLPVPADYDGDGKADKAVYRASTSTWYRLNSSNGAFVSTVFGISTDKPAVADYDGDGKADICVFRVASGDWYRINSSTNTVVSVHFGQNGDKATPADFDGDGKADISVFRSSAGDWYRVNSNGGAFVGFHFGANGDLPSPADFDGDGKADYAVFRPSAGTWYIQRSISGFLGQAFGANGDTPSPNSFVY